MEFLEGSALRKAILELPRQSRLHCAVAFWGLGSNGFIDSTNATNIKLICNLKAGGTNPSVIEKLPRTILRQCDTLHAKVYIGDSAAIVSSANMSCNGLGFEGSEQQSWLEAGVKLTNTDAVTLWFDDLWARSNEISDDEIEEARKKWTSRRTTRATLASFRDFNTEAEDLPLIAWTGNANWNPNPTLKKEFKNDANRKEFVRRINFGVDIRGPSDRKALKPETWVLKCKSTSANKPSKKGKLSFVLLGKIQEKAFAFEESPRTYLPVALAAEIQRPPPFDPSDPKFVIAFKEVILRKQFSDLLNWDARNEQGWYTKKRLALIKPLWHAIKERYQQI